MITGTVLYWNFFETLRGFWIFRVFRTLNFFDVSPLRLNNIPGTMLHWDDVPFIPYSRITEVRSIRVTVHPTCGKPSSSYHTQNTLLCHRIDYIDLASMTSLRVVISITSATITT